MPSRSGFVVRWALNYCYLYYVFCQLTAHINGTVWRLVCASVACG